MPILSGRARLAGVIGWPVGHSRSPLLHNHWLARHGIDGAYVPMPVAPERFEVALAGLTAAGFRGVNVTIPHKEAAFRLCVTLDDAARTAGAANTLVFAEDGIHGSLTDGTGLLAHLEASGIDPAAGPALLLGAGGAARGIAAALRARGVAVTVANRTEARADSLAADLPGVRTVAWERTEAALADHALLVNTTALGMQGQPALVFSLQAASPQLAVADVVYAPLETPLLAQARARGLRTADGLGMLIQQARPGFAAWFGVLPEAGPAEHALLAATL